MTDSGPVFEVIQLASVRRADLKAALQLRTIEWQSACHVTATSSLAAALWRSDDLAVSIAVLLDLIVVSGRIEGGPGSLAEYPAAAEFGDLERYRDRAIAWSSAVDGDRVRRAMRIDDVLRQFARTRTTDAREARLLVRERRQFQRAVQTLVAAGLSPDCNEFQPGTPIAVTARDAWREIEQVCPEVGHMREDLWQGDGSGKVVSRVQAALERVFGPRQRWTIVHHGFYFYTPPQWALFRLLRNHALADQYFIVHDDGTLPMFEIWRRFFSSRWGMPESKRLVAKPTRPSTQQALAFRAAWLGEKVAAGQLAEQLRIVEYRSPAEFVRSALHSAVEARGDAVLPARMFCAQHAEIQRYCDRLGPLAEGGQTVLAQLPVGAFLLRLHECIQSSHGSGVRLVLTSDALRDIATSGFLALPAGTPSISAMRAALSRALPYFRDCTFVSEWVARAQSLERIVVDGVGRLGVRDASHSDVERLNAAIKNPMRLAPWADLSVSEVGAIRLAVEAIARALEELARAERVSFKDHAEFVARHVRLGTASLPPDQRAKIDSKLRGFSIGLSGDVDVSGLIDVVSLLLGRDAPDDTDQGTPATEGARHGAILPLRALDALGFAASKSPLHVANLADGAFPSAVPAIGWPFRREDIVDPLHIGRGLLETRSEHAALGDLYLLWLALDGVEPTVSITLSWMSEIAGDPRNPSSVLGMLSCPAERSLDAVAAKIGGLGILRPASSGEAASRFRVPVATATKASDVELSEALKLLPRGVAAMSLACPRWLASHFLFGPTVAHSADFQHFRLYGNLIGGLQKAHGFSEILAKECADGLWRFLSPGERASSRRHCVVAAAGGARAEWMLTLDGSSKRSDPVAKAYKSAAAIESAVSLPVVQSFGSGFLPPPSHAKRGAVCKFCPAQSRCLMAQQSRDDAD
jgi:hypothetical protein